MKNGIMFFLLLALLMGCKRDPLPGKALSEKVFINILVDIHIAEGMYQERNQIHLDSLKSEPLYLSVLEKHKVPEEKMVATTLYYSRHPREYDKIFTEVLSRISVLMEEQDQPVKIIEPAP